MPATLFIISQQNIHKCITFNFESCCYPKTPQYQRLAHIAIHAVCTIFLFTYICKPLFYIEKHWHVGNNYDCVCVCGATY